jgi:flagellar hook-associated protein 1 FlgK
MIESVNAIHRQGYGLDGSTNLDFFDSTFTSAATIRLNFDIVDHTERIAASASGEAGDNVIALQMQELRNAKTMIRGSATMNEYYNSVVGELGVMSGQAKSFAANYELLVQQIDNTRQSVQGVSLDEEMTNMVKYQHAYDAAARVVTAMDQALSTVIGQMGIVGR